MYLKTRVCCVIIVIDRTRRSEKISTARMVPEIKLISESAHLLFCHYCNICMVRWIASSIA